MFSTESVMKFQLKTVKPFGLTNVFSYMVPGVGQSLTCLLKLLLPDDTNHKQSISPDFTVLLCVFSCPVLKAEGELGPRQEQQ